MGMGKTAKQVEARMVNVLPKAVNQEVVAVIRLVPYPERPTQRVDTCDKKLMGGSQLSP